MWSVPEQAGPHSPSSIKGQRVVSFEGAERSQASSPDAGSPADRRASIASSFDEELVSGLRERERERRGSIASISDFYPGGELPHTHRRSLTGAHSPASDISGSTSRRMSTTVVTDLQTRIRSKQQEIQALQSVLKRFSADEEEITRSNSSHLSALGAKDNRIRNLETKVKRVEQELQERDKTIAKMREEIELLEHSSAFSFAAIDKGNIANVIQEHVQDLRDDLSKQRGALVERNKQQSDEMERVLRKNVKLNGKIKDLHRSLEYRCRVMERDLMLLHDSLQKAENQNAVLVASLQLARNSAARTEKMGGGKLVFPEGWDKEKYDIHFGEPVDLRATDDEYVGKVIERSNFSDTLREYKGDLLTWAKDMYSRQDGVMKSLWVLLDQPKTSSQPRKDAHRAISDVQRKSKQALADMVRRVNAMCKGLVDREKVRLKEVVAEYEQKKCETRATVATMCIIPDPPPPAMAVLRQRIVAMEEANKSMKEKMEECISRRNQMEADMNACYESCYDTHASIYTTFKAVWTHRYRFVEHMEDPVREIGARKGMMKGKPGTQGIDLLRRIFVSNAEEVLTKDRELLECFARYVTSEELYQRDMVAQARQKREEEARRKNDGLPSAKLSEERRKSSLRALKAAVKTIGSFSRAVKRQSLQSGQSGQSGPEEDGQLRDLQPEESEVIAVDTIRDDGESASSTPRPRNPPPKREMEALTDEVMAEIQTTSTPPPEAEVPGAGTPEGSRETSPRERESPRQHLEAAHPEAVPEGDLKETSGDGDAGHTPRDESDSREETQKDQGEKHVAFDVQGDGAPPAGTEPREGGKSEEPPAVPEFPVGSTVQVYGLQLREWKPLNGKVGIVVGYAKVSGTTRVLVDFPDPHGQLRLKPCNLHLAPGRKLPPSRLDVEAGDPQHETLRGSPVSAFRRRRCPTSPTSLMEDDRPLPALDGVRGKTFVPGKGKSKSLAFLNERNDLPETLAEGGEDAPWSVKSTSASPVPEARTLSPIPVRTVLKTSRSPSLSPSGGQQRSGSRAKSSPALFR